MVVEPDPQGGHEPAEFRLAGYAGGAVFLRAVVLPPPAGTAAAPTLDLPVVVGVSVALDVMLLTPDWHCWFMGRRAERGFVDRLARFFFAAAADFEPQESVEPLVDHLLGLTVSVPDSTKLDVVLSWRVAHDPLDPDPESAAESLTFVTSRSAVAGAARAVRSLDGNHDHSPLEAYSL